MTTRKGSGHTKSQFSKVSFICTDCGRAIKKEEPHLDSEGPREDTKYYKHAGHYRKDGTYVESR